MNILLANCRVHFPVDYDERGEWEVEGKGWLQGVEVELPNGTVYPLFLYDPVRLAQDLEADEALGRCAVAEPGMVVIPEVTRTAILRAAEDLVRRGYFDHLRPLRKSIPETLRAVADGHAASITPDRPVATLP